MFKTSLLIIAALIGFQASAATQVWDLSNSSGTSSSLSMNINGVNANITGWSGTGYQNMSQAWIGQWSSGSGVIHDWNEYNSNTHHSMDNSGQYDAMLITFDQEVSLDSFSIGWHYNDSDVSVAAYTGNGSMTDLSGTSWNSFLTSGWTSQGSFSDVANNTYQSISPTVTSKSWLISAYNPFIANMGWSTGNDFMKLSGLQTSQKITTEVPEPAAIALFLLGLATLAGRKRNV